MIDLQRDGELFIATMNDGENRWNTTFVRAFAAVLDEVESSTGAAALVTESASEKFFSNGLDLEWLSDDRTDHPGGDRAAFGTEFMALMARIITFPMPTVSAINGHAFGAGFMLALCHDVRLMRADRGFVCANEMQLGMVIPAPELALFKHKLSASVFFETVQLARRWAGPEARDAGIVAQIEPLEGLAEAARARALALAPLAANRKAYAGQKESIFGDHAAIHGSGGPAHMLRNPADYRH